MSVILMDRQRASLDALLDQMRTKGAVGMTRAGVIRSLIDALFADKLDLQRVTSEAELKQALQVRVRPRKRSRPS